MCCLWKEKKERALMATFPWTGFYPDVYSSISIFGVRFVKLRVLSFAAFCLSLPFSLLLWSDDIARCTIHFLRALCSSQRKVAGRPVGDDCEQSRIRNTSHVVMETVNALQAMVESVRLGSSSTASLQLWHPAVVSVKRSISVQLPVIIQQCIP